jgi:hypothetical protein
MRSAASCTESKYVDLQLRAPGELAPAGPSMPVVLCCLPAAAAARQAEHVWHPVCRFCYALTSTAALNQNKRVFDNQQ